MAARERRSLSNLLEVLIEREEARMRAQYARDTCASQHPEGQEET